MTVDQPKYKRHMHSRIVKLVKQFISERDKAELEAFKSNDKETHVSMVAKVGTLDSVIMRMVDEFGVTEGELKE